MGTHASQPQCGAASDAAGVASEHAVMQAGLGGPGYISPGSVGAPLPLPPPPGKAAGVLLHGSQPRGGPGRARLSSTAEIHQRGAKQAHWRPKLLTLQTAHGKAAEAQTRKACKALPPV